MKNKTVIVIAGLFLAAVLAAVAAHAQFAPRHGRGMQHGGMFADLNLTDAQKKSVGDIFTSNRENMRALMQRMRDQRRLVSEASQKQPFDESTVRFQAQELAKIQSEAIVQRAALMNRVAALLTPEQKAKWQELRAQRQARFKERFEQRRGERGA